MDQGETTLDDDRSSGEIKTEIDNTRSRMDRTLDELGNRIEPRAILHSIIDCTKGDSESGRAVRNTVRALVRPIRENPLPAIALGASTVWLIAQAAQDDDESEELESDGSDEYRHRRTYDRGARQPAYPGAPSEPGTTLSGREGADSRADEGLKSKAAKIGAQVRDRTADVAESVREAGRSIQQSAADVGSAAKETVGEHARAISDRARRAARRTRRRGNALYDEAAASVSDAFSATKERYERGLDENPLGLAIGFLGVGILAGALLPVSRREHELMGEASDEITDSVKAFGDELLEKGKRVGEKVAHSALDQVEEADVDTGKLSELTDEVKETVKKAASNVKEEAKRAVDEEIEDLTTERVKAKAKKEAQTGQGSSPTRSY